MSSPPVSASDEIRNGLISQEIAAARQAHSLREEAIIDKKLAQVDGTIGELLALRYERVVPILVGAVKPLVTHTLTSAIWP